MVLFTIVSLIFIHVDFHDHAVTVVRFAFVNEKRVKEDNDAKGPETFPFKKLPPLVMMEILSYVGYRDLLNGFLMTNSEMMDVARGLVTIKSVSQLKAFLPTLPSTPVASRHSLTPAASWSTRGHVFASCPGGRSSCPEGSW
jgi:hypothetical protein